MIVDIETIKTKVLPLALAAAGVRPDFTPESLDQLEASLNGMFAAPHEPRPSTVMIVGVYLGEVLVQNIPGSRWVSDVPNLVKAKVVVPIPHGHVDVYPLVRANKFFLDRTDGLGVLFRMLNATNLGFLDPTKATGRWTNVPRADGVDSFRFTEVKGGESK